MFSAYPLAGTHDRVYSAYGPPPHYLDYLDRLHIAYPQQAKTKNNYSHYSPEVWGWDAVTREVLTGLGTGFSCPGLATVTSVNSRIFSNDIARKLHAPHACLCKDFPDIQYAEKQINSDRIVIKQLFGSSGSGFLIRKKGEWSKYERLKLDSFFRSSPGGVLAGPWHNRVSDFSLFFHLSKNGTIEDLTANRLVNNQRGIFSSLAAGALSPDNCRFYEELTDTATHAAQALHQAGYFGPAGIDAYSYYDTTNREVLNPLSEINARRTMAAVALLGKAKLGTGACTLLSLSGKKLKPFRDYAAYTEHFDGLHFNAASGAGIVLLLPLFYFHNNNTVYPGRNLALVCGNDPAETESLRVKFMERINDCKK